ncbi:MAG: GNAT family N-acetyltransferase [Hyphomicrobiaceae bacterium]
MARLSQMLRRKSTEGGLIRTARLVLRPLREDDLFDIARLAGDWAIASMTARIPYPYTPDDARQWLYGLEEGEFVRAMTMADEGQLLGITGYLPSEEGRVAEIGYWVGKPYWGRGIATEAAHALVEHCFARAGFEKLTCCHFADNPGSARVIEKLGFKSTGSCSCWCEARRIEAPAEHYELLRGEWRKFKRRGV